MRNRVGPPLAIADAGLAGPEVEVEAEVEACEGSPAVFSPVLLLSPLYAGSASRKASRLAVVGGESSLEELGRAMPRPRPRPLGRDDINVAIFVMGTKWKSLLLLGPPA